jgi:uridine kinase
MDPDLSEIKLAEHRKDVQVRFSDGRVFSGPAGTFLESFMRKAQNSSAMPMVAAVVNGRVADLREPVIADVDAEPISLATEDGIRIYQRSLVLLLACAVRELFNVRIAVDHSLTFGGLFCRVLGRAPFNEHEISQIEARMKLIVNENAPIHREVTPITQAIAWFRENADEEQARVISHLDRMQITLRSLRGTREYFFGGLLVPSTGYLKQFNLRLYADGIGLQSPQKSRPTALEPARFAPKLTTVFLEYGQWLELVGVSDMDSLNQALAEGRAREIILVAEALHAQKISEMASQIVARRGQARLITIAGPSSSGKTTFAKRLAVQLLANGLRPFPLSLDDYFVSREETPRDEKGEYDYENFLSLDLPLLNGHLDALMNGKSVTLPRYNFTSGEREKGPVVQLTPDHVLMIEGIHGLNPNLVQLSRDKVFRIYVSSLTQLRLDRLNRVPTTDTRLIRRIVRDAYSRNYSARDTIARWSSVRRGEDRNIFPFQEQADVMFNSALVYELAALKPMLEPLLQQVTPGSPEYIEAQRLISFLKWFKACESTFIPEVSILREFIGGSVLADFIPHI